ncbi:hypothetical protein A6A27_22505 [Micromonospora sp. CB01531]|nr:hypothetical protein A6A27_22505 [Micromonospora sp. CB01531]
MLPSLAAPAAAAWKSRRTWTRGGRPGRREHRCLLDLATTVLACFIHDAPILPWAASPGHGPAAGPGG